MRASRAGLLSGDAEDHLSQMSLWLEEYRQLAEKRDAENFQLRLQISQLFENEKKRDAQEQALQGYVVELEETVRVLGDELERAQRALAQQEREIARMARRLQGGGEGEGKAGQAEEGEEGEASSLLAEALALHEESAQQQQLIHRLEERLNDKESLCLDLQTQIKELELTLRLHHVAFSPMRTRQRNNNNSENNNSTQSNNNDSEGEREKEKEGERLFTLDIALSPVLSRRGRGERGERGSSRAEGKGSGSDDEPPSPSSPLKISRDLTNKLTSHPRHSHHNNNHNHSNGLDSQNPSSIESQNPRFLEPQTSRFLKDEDWRRADPHRGERGLGGAEGARGEIEGGIVKRRGRYFSYYSPPSSPGKGKGEGEERQGERVGRGSGGNERGGRGRERGGEGQGNGRGGSRESRSLLGEEERRERDEEEEGLVEGESQRTLPPAPPFFRPFQRALPPREELPTPPRPHLNNNSTNSTPHSNNSKRHHK